METQQSLSSSSSLAIHYSKNLLVKPSKPTPEEFLSLSSIDNDSYIETLSKTLYVYKANDDHGDTVRRDPCSVIKEALSDVLVYYYPLAGKLKRCGCDAKLRLICSSGGGVPFVEAAAECTLASLGYLDDVDAGIGQKFVPGYEVDNKDDDGYHPLAFQVTKFSCGGFVIGMALSHSVCDGFGAAQFFRALAELAAGKLEPTVKPLWERQRLTVELPDDTPPKSFPASPTTAVATSPYAPSGDAVRKTVNVNAEMIKRLKRRVVKDSSSDAAADDFVKDISFTTLEVLAAYVWRARFRALKLNPDGVTVFGVAVGVRSILDPPLPEGYYGNAFVKAHVALTGRELNDSPLSHITRLIRNAKKSATEKNFVRDQMIDIEKMLKMKMEFSGGNGAFTLLTDWRQLGLLDEIDFGWKETVNLVPLTPLEIMDLCIFLPPSKLDLSMAGGVRVLVTLPKAAMAAFKEEMEGLNRLGDDDDAASA